MPSIENFNWILFENLLRPTGLDVVYYFPFGTTQNISFLNEFKVWDPNQEHHVLFHFEQEPLYTDYLGQHYENVPKTWSNKICKILANSEHSSLKNDLCRSRPILDWYFFYHGFAALDWYADVEYVMPRQKIECAFLSFNHLVTRQRAYRIALLARLAQHGVLQNNMVSFYGTRSDIENEISSSQSLLSLQDRSMILENLDVLPELPMVLDKVEPNGSLSARLGHQEYSLWQKPFVHLVNETVFFPRKSHLTEKIFKPIVSMRPFILAAAPGNLRYLRSYGFQTFDKWIDESYDEIQDDVQRLDIIARETARLAKKSLIELETIRREMRSVLEFNRTHFFNGFKTQIVNELVHNFDHCVRRWNHARVDGRELNMHPDLNGVKNILLR